MELNKKVILYSVGIIILMGIDIYGTSFFVGWRNHFWSGIQALDLQAFWHDIGTFSMAALALVFGSAYTSFLMNRMAIYLRERKVKRLLSVPVEKYSNVPNYKQRIENDSWEIYNLGISLSFALGKAIVLLGVFLYLLVGMIHSTKTLIIVALYVVIATILSRILAKPLIKVNYDLQTLATDFRDTLSLAKFGELQAMYKIWADKTKIINLFQALFSQVSVIIPYIMLAPAYFSKGITFGVLMACGSLIGQLIADAGWVIASVDTINRFHSSRIRIKELEESIK